MDKTPNNVEFIDIVPIFDKDTNTYIIATDLSGVQEIEKALRLLNTNRINSRNKSKKKGESTKRFIHYRLIHTSKS